MVSESRKVLAVLSLLLLAAVVAMISVVVVLAERNKDISHLKDQLSKYESAKGDEDDKLTVSDVDWDKCDDVSIIGAGIAGAYASYRLRDIGKKITIYEYSDRIGGRCYTGKLTGVPDVNVEYGAMRFRPGKHKLLTKAIDELGLATIPFEPQSGPFSYSNVYLRGQHLSYEDIPNQDMPYYLPDKFKGKTLAEINWELFRDNTNVNPNEEGYLNDRLNLKSADGVELWKQSRRDFNMKYLPADTAKYLQDVGAWDGTYQNSSAALAVPTHPPSSSSSEPQQTVASGFQSIPETMIAKFLDTSVSHRFLANHQLISIRKNETNGKYALIFLPTETRNGITEPIRGESHPKYACASKVILAVGRLALEQIDWEGLRQPEIHDYITNSLSDIPAAKLYLAFNNAWWRNFSFEELDKPHYSLSDTPLRNTFEYAVSKTANMAVLNAGYMDLNLNVRLWRKLNELGTKYPGTSESNVATTSEVVRYAMKFLSEIYNVSITNLNDPTYAAIGLWDRYPYGAAWYKWKPGYNWKEVETKMLKPSASDDIFVACNAFSSTNRSTMTEGALEIVQLVLKYFLSENS